MTIKAGITLDDWKLPIFERHLKQHGYEYVNEGLLMAGVLVLTVTTENPHALADVIKRANDEAATTKRGSKGSKRGH